MKILVVGSGGREHVMAWKIAQSDSVSEVFVCPGNGGTATEPSVTNVAIDSTDIDGLAGFAEREGIDLTIVGPEAPLVAGIVDRFQERGLRCFGPSSAAAQLEGSKEFMKAFLVRHGIPTGHYRAFNELRPALSYLSQVGAPIVIKADGLAAGKGVIVAHDMDIAETAVRDMLEGHQFGAAGKRIVIEEFLEGEEASFIAIVDGTTVLPFASSQDHKPRDNGDLGPNTGGMGAYSPAPVVTPELHSTIMERIMIPTVKGMAEEGIPYVGFLYAGVMIDEAGEPRVLEFNCRFGDPEAQPILMRMKSDFATLCSQAMDADLKSATIDWDSRAALGVVMVAGGYPGKYHGGDSIEGLDQVTESRCKIFHAGTRMAEGRVVTNGGRVLCVTALGDDVQEAKDTAYESVHKIMWRDAYYRTDIGHRAIGR